MFGLGPMEMLVFGVIAVLLFGKRLPEVGRSMGKGIMEFKKGMHDIQSEMDTAAQDSPARVSHHNAIDDYEEATAPKFEPPAREPQEVSSTDASAAEPPRETV